MLGLIFVIVLLVLILISFFLLFYDDIRYHFEKKNHRKKIYRILSRYAEEEDCYLLNDVKLFLRQEDVEPTTFDHLLFTEKYIYIISDFLAFGGVYGNVKDASLFLKKTHGKTESIPNPILRGKALVHALEETVMISHDKNAFICMTVYNPSLVVPKGIHIKDCESCFISVDELEETIAHSQEDSVTCFKDEKMKRLVDAIKTRSDLVKEEMKKSKKKEKK